MKTIGLIGGMSWESTSTYYQEINKLVNNKLGGFHSAKIILASVDFNEIEECQSHNDWATSGEILGKQAAILENAGADIILICTNTMHKVFDQVQSYVTVPLLLIADATINELKLNDINKVGLLGTKYTLKENFYKERLENSSVKVLTPNDEDIETVNDIIFNELVHGLIKSESKMKYAKIIEKLKKSGAQAIILGCTEIGLLINQKDSVLPIFDTTLIHAKNAVDKALY